MEFLSHSPNSSNDTPLRRIFESILDSVIVTNLDGKIIDCNPATESMFGFTRSELLEKTPGELWHRPHESHDLNQRIRDAVQESGLWQGEIHFVRKDKSPGVADVVVVPLLDESGQQIGKIGVSRDITDRVAAQSSLELQKQTLENLVAIARAITRRLDITDTLQDSVEVAARLTGATYGTLFLLSEANVATHFLLVNRSGSTPEKQRDIIEAVLEGGLAGWVVKNKCIGLVEDAKNDPRWLNLPEQPYYAGSALVIPLLDYGEKVVGVLSLIHEEPHHFTAEHARLLEGSADQLVVALANAQLYEDQKKLNEELTLAKNAAESASRAKSAFLASVSHEVRTPLNAIIGYTELVRDILEEREINDLLPDLQNILKSAGHLLDLITDILDISKIEAGRMPINPQLFDLHVMVEAVANGVRPQMEANGNHLDITVDEEAVLLFADPLRVKQILINLLSNAAKFTRHGTVGLRVWHTGEPGEERVHFEVSDNGIGIMPDLLPKVFEPFVVDTDRTHVYQTGIGLGLPISQQFCRMMGGEITVESTPGEGATFRFSLPNLHSA